MVESGRRSAPRNERFLASSCPAKWRSPMSRYHSVLVLAWIAGCVHETQTPPTSAPPPSSTKIVEDLPAKGTESRADDHQYPSTGVEMWDPVRRPVSKGTESRADGHQYPSTGVEMWDPERWPVSSQPQSAVRPLTAAERERAISVAREYLFKGDPEPEEIEYNVRRTDDGYSVFVQFAWVPGGHCSLRISSKWEVTELIRGA